MPILGIDEVGRGPLAGPLVVGAVVLPERFKDNGESRRSQLWQEDLADSKQISKTKREKLAKDIKVKSVARGLGWVPAAELDRLGMTESLRLATRRAICQLLKIDAATNEKNLKNLPADLPFDEIIVDGTQNFLKGTPLESITTTLIKADTKIKEVSAAAIFAKVARDNYMSELGDDYSAYGFRRNVGYGTSEHLAALKKYGPCDEHRLSFSPVAKADHHGGSAYSIVPSPLPDWLKDPSTVEIGQRAETVVADYLKSQGHKILERNHKTKFYEIDVISADKNHIYFTEVKYRKNSSHGMPLDSITMRKRQQIAFAANSYMKYLCKKKNCRLEDLPSPILAAAAVEGPDFKLKKWFEIKF